MILHNVKLLYYFCPRKIDYFIVNLKLSYIFINLLSVSLKFWNGQLFTCLGLLSSSWLFYSQPRWGQLSETSKLCVLTSIFIKVFFFLNQKNKHILSVVHSFFFVWRILTSLKKIEIMFVVGTFACYIVVVILTT